jgi:hypothetical protein
MYNGFYQMGYTLGQSIGKAIFGDPQEEARRQAQALQQNRQMMQSLDGMGKDQGRQEDERRLNALQQARLLEEMQRQETLSVLKGTPKGDGELALKPSTDFFGIPGPPKNSPPPPSDPSVVDLRHLDPAKPITVDNLALREFPRETKKETVTFPPAECEKKIAVRDRLAAGLPVQEEAITRTEAQLEAAKKGIAEASAEKRQVLLEGAVEEAKGYAKEVMQSAEFLRSQVSLLKGLDVDKGKRDLLIHSFHTVFLEGEALAKAALAGYASGDEMRSKVDRLSREILPQAYKVMIESGIAEMAGEELSEKLGGPLGALGFRGARLSIDFTVALGKGKIGEAEREAAQRNLDTMRSQHRRARERISRLDRDLAEGCGDTRQARP